MENTNSWAIPLELIKRMVDHNKEYMEILNRAGFFFGDSEGVHLGRIEFMETFPDHYVGPFDEELIKRYAYVDGVKFFTLDAKEEPCI